MKRWLGTLFMLFPTLLFALETCPEASSITRVPGEYAWQSADGRWEGYFALPRTGRGDSNQVTFFLQARWIQLTDMLDSKGVVECDYTGNSNAETIRFVTNVSAATSKPRGPHWSCDFNPDVPGTRCVCSGDSKDCWL